MTTQRIPRPPSVVLSARLRTDDAESSSQGQGEISISRHGPSTSRAGVRHYIHDLESQNGKEFRAVRDVHTQLSAQVINFLGSGFGKPGSSPPELPTSSISSTGSRLSLLHPSRQTPKTSESTTTEPIATTSITSSEGPRRRQVEQQHPVSSSGSRPDQPAQAAVNSSEEEPFEVKPYPVGARKRDKIIHVLGPMFNTTPCILLFDGKPGPVELGQVVIVPVKDSLGDTEALFQKIHMTWHARFGRYRRLLPNVYGVKNMEMVKIQVLGSSVQPRREEDLSGICHAVDGVLEIQAEIRRVEAEIDRFQKEFASVLWAVDDHDNFCPAWIDDLEWHTCKYTTWKENKRRLGELKWNLTMATVIPRAFVNPSLAFAHDDLLRSFIYAERDMNELTQLNPFDLTMVGLDELRFNGLRIEMGWMAKPLKARALPILATAVLSILIGARFIFGDWATAWTTVGSLAAVAAVMLTWVTLPSPPWS
ncbi:hypothetical protein B0H66DRAFT_641815 [Apodospora peruviana]|uniref:Uncharacterized protein n=1 Tax=Apodospora peruviana TaxID=516989 RepID=A0AAE0I223_9PEZI|nr:hypothetical protein B0H66DRAFT_641815 [Apodospora peruviana]